MNGNNKVETVLYDLIEQYTEDLELYDTAIRNPALDKIRRNEILSNVEETAYKLSLAAKDLKMLINKGECK